MTSNQGLIKDILLLLYKLRFTYKAYDQFVKDDILHNYHQENGNRTNVSSDVEH